MKKAVSFEFKTEEVWRILWRHLLNNHKIDPDYSYANGGSISGDVKGTTITVVYNKKESCDQ